MVNFENNRAERTWHSWKDKSYCLPSQPSNQFSFDQASKKTMRYFELTTNGAHLSTYGRIRHGAILVKGGSVINTGFNKQNFSSFGSRFRDKAIGYATQHAEISAIFGIPKTTTSGGDIYVVRIGKGNELRISKPCDMCDKILDFVGIKRVFYSIDENHYGMYKIGK
jgi:deoxycytidylate deaminase